MGVDVERTLSSTASGATLGSKISPGLGTVIGAGIGAVASIFGNKKQSSAGKYAANVQSQAAQRALDYEREQAAYERQKYEEERDYTRRQREEQLAYGRQQYANYLDRLSPYTQAGSKAVTQYERQTAPMVAATVPSMARGGGMVTLKSPTGSVRQVPAAQAAHYISLGAERLS
jgi:uncharacterized protein YlxW (UPF0749 family)